MKYPSLEVALAVESTKEFTLWLAQGSFQNFEQAWMQCPIGVAMFNVLLTLNPTLKDLHWVALRAALRAVQAENMDIDERLLDYLAQKRAALTLGEDNYGSEAAISRAISLNRIYLSDAETNRSKPITNMAVGWACCNNPRSCGMALNSAVHAERFRHGTRLESMHQANDIRELFSTPLSILRFKVPSRYQRPWIL